MVGWFTLKRLRARLVELVGMDEKVQMEALVQLDPEELMVLRGQMALLVGRVQRVLMGQRDRRAPPETLASPAPPAPDASRITSTGSSNVE